MNIARSLNCLKQKPINQCFSRSLKVSSTIFESSQSTQPKVVGDKFDFEDLKINERTDRRKAPIPPFMKDVMVSIYNRELLAYPEVLNKEEMEELDNRVHSLNSVFSNPTTSDERVNCLRQNMLFGAPIDLTQNGLAFNVTERIRYLETVSTDISLAKALSEHWIGLGVLNTCSQRDILTKLLPEIIDGSHNITLCTKETPSTRVEQADFRTNAKLDSHGVWRINGEKLCSNDSGYFLVLSNVEAMRIEPFLVHPDAAGVSFMEPYIAFRDTPATILEPSDQSELACCLGLSRLDTAVMSYSLIRKTLVDVFEFVRGKYIAGRPLAETSTLQSRVGNALQTIYTAESMAYFTAGLLDGYHSPDVELEMAMCRSYISHHGIQTMLELVDIPGLDGTKEPWSAHLHEFRKLNLKDETLDGINSFIALTGIHHVGKVLATDVKQLRNPLFHPMHVMKKMWSNRHQDEDRPKLSLFLAEHLHPSLKQPAEDLEYSVLRMKYASETLLVRHGVKIGHALHELDRLGQAATEILAMTSVLARASRSYCIGVRNAEVEMKLAATIVERSRRRLRSLIKDIDDGEYLNLDHFTLNFGKKVLDTGTTLVEKPTERVFW